MAMDSDNVSPEPFLKGVRKLRPPVQVSPVVGGVQGGKNKFYVSLPSPRDDFGSTSGKGDDELEAWGEQSGGRVATRELVAEGGKAGNGGGSTGGDSDTGASETGLVRNESYMPRHPKSEVNPFINTTMRLPWHQYVKMVIVGVTLLPLRIVFTVMNVFVMWIFATCVLTGLSEDDIEMPFTRYRLALKYPICWCLRFQTFLFGFWWIRTKGECASKQEAPIIVSNHVSPFEPFYLVGKTMATPVQRIEDSRAPIVGTIQKAMQIMFVDRSNPASRKKCLQTIEERSDPQSRFPQVMVFPEGTCTNQRALITFKHGPFTPGQAVQPVIVRYHFRDLDPSYPAVAPSLGALALRVMCQVWNCMEVEYLPVYVPTLEDRSNPGVFALHVQEYMSRSLGVPATQHAFEDVALQFQAMKMNLDPEVAVVEWSRVRESLDIDAGTAKEYLIVFFEMDADRDGKLSLEEFCSPWKRKRDAEAERQFQAAVSRARRRAEAAAEVEGDVLTGPQIEHFGDNESQHGIKVGLHLSPASSFRAKTVPNSDIAAVEGNRNGHAGSPGEAAETAAAAGLPGLLREEEMERAYEIFRGGEELDFQRFLTGLGVLGGLTRDGRVGLFKFIFSMLQGNRNMDALPRREVEQFVRRLRPDLTAGNARHILDEAIKLEKYDREGEFLAEGNAEDGEGSERPWVSDVSTSSAGGAQEEEREEERVVTRNVFLNLAERNGSILSIYQAMLLNDILGVERDIAEFGLSVSADFGGLALDTTELERTLDELVGPASLV